jgi:hypothetical protein
MLVYRHSAIHEVKRRMKFSQRMEQSEKEHTIFIRKAQVVLLTLSFRALWDFHPQIAQIAQIYTSDK